MKNKITDGNRPNPSAIKSQHFVKSSLATLTDASIFRMRPTSVNMEGSSSKINS